MRGSQGAGIRVLTKAELLACASDSRLRCRSRPGLSFPIVQPYLAEPLVASGGPYKGHKWDLRTYVLCTSVLPMRLYLFTEAIVRSAAARSNLPPKPRAVHTPSSAVSASCRIYASRDVVAGTRRQATPPTRPRRP